MAKGKKNDVVEENGAVESTEDGAVEKEAEKTAKPKVEIIRGRMPLVVVHMIRFKSDPDMSRSSLAAMYRTTVGKINDVLAGNNFPYIKEDFKPTEAMVEAAVKYLEQCDTDLVDIAKSYAVATEDEAAAFEELRKGSRKSRKSAGYGAGAGAVKAETDDSEDVIEDDGLSDEAEASDDECDELLED
jgi:hypothetical protein